MFAVQRSVNVRAEKKKETDEGEDEKMQGPGCCFRRHEFCVMRKGGASRYGKLFTRGISSTLNFISLH